MRKNHIDIISLGCSKNLVDSEALMRQFEAVGYTVSHDPEHPNGNIAIINTCGFIGDAKEESINMILRFCQRKQSGQLERLYVMGCLSQRYLEELKIEIPEVDKFYGKFDYNGIIADIGKEYRQDLRLERHLTTPKHYAYLKISEGCNRTCSYCAIPIITGKYKSRTIEDIEQEVRWLVSKGVKEFQVIAQDLTYYGYDIYKDYKIADLISRLSDIKGVEWLRLHYAYPTNFPYSLLTVMREKDNVCNYLDIALQHISDPMLKKMRRSITSDETYDLIARIREEVPGICLRTTLMVGHPGETEADFNQLKEFVQKVKFDRMGAFKYSDEEKTYANLHYIDDVPLDVKQDRLDELMNIQQSISYDLNKSKIGQVWKVIIDREEGDYYVARSEFDSPEIDMEILIPKDENSLSIGNFYKVKIIGAEEFDFYAKIQK